MIRRIIVWSTENPRVLLGLVLALSAASLVSARRLRLDALPDVTGQQVLVLTQAPGFTPEEVERLVTRPVEVALGGVPGLERQRSLSRYGLSAVTAVFGDEVDLVRARQLVAERLASLPELPRGVSPPELGPITGGLGEIYHFELRGVGRSPTELLELVELRVAPLLRAVAGVVEVNTWGGMRRTLDVVADPSVMGTREVTLADLRGAVEAATGAVPGDALAGDAARVLVRARALPSAPRELEGAVVAQTERGGALLVGDVARVEVGAAPRLGAATVDGRGESVYVMVQMLRGENALEVLRALHEVLPEVARVLPSGVEMVPIYDRSDLVYATLKTVGMNLVEGGLLVALILFLTLGSARAAWIVALTIPLAMMGALVGMVALDVPGNLMSLGAIDFGLLVDGAVVLVEAVFHRFESHPGEPAKDAIQHAMASVARPVTFSIAVILLVYVPILALEGVEGKMFRPMAVTVTLALAGALALTLTFIPAAATMFIRPEHLPAGPPRLVRLLERVYRPALAWTVRHRAPAIGIAATTLIAGAVVAARSGTAFVPQLSEGDLVIQTTRRPDISLEAAVRAAGGLERALLTVPEVRGVYSRIGSPAVATDVMGLEQADVFVTLTAPDAWRAGFDREALLEEIARVASDASEGAETALTQPIQMRFNELLGGDTTDVSVSVFGPELTVAHDAAGEIARRLADLRGAADVRVLAPPAVPLVDVSPDPLRSARFGMSVSAVLDAVQAMRVGLPAGATYDDVLRIPIRLRVEAPTADGLADALISTPEGPIPLSELATITHANTPSMISHDRTERRVGVGFNVRGRDLGGVVEEAHARLGDLALADGYRLVWGGQYEAFEAAKRRLGAVVPLVFLGIVGLLLLLFKRLRPVAIIAMHIPFAAVGGVFALALRGLPISVSAAVGFIALSGIAVLNGVVLVSRIEEVAAAGAPYAEAALQAARSRLRPVSTTAMVAAFGFVPMMLATGAGAEVQRPLATVVVGGLVTSTTVTLLLLPTIYPLLAGRSRAGRTSDEDTDR